MNNGIGDIIVKGMTGKTLEQLSEDTQKANKAISKSNEKALNKLKNNTTSYLDKLKSNPEEYNKVLIDTNQKLLKKLANEKAVKVKVERELQRTCKAYYNLSRELDDLKESIILKENLEKASEKSYILFSDLSEEEKEKLSAESKVKAKRENRDALDEVNCRFLRDKDSSDVKIGNSGTVNSSTRCNISNELVNGTVQSSTLKNTDRGEK